MKKIAILSFLAFYFCAITYLTEFLKVPVLFSHFKEHKEDNNSITFYKFIYQHYEDDDGNDQDDDRDSQLPFKSQDTSIVVLSSIAIPSSLTKVLFNSVIRTVELKLDNYMELYIPSPYLSRIWQPPKF